MGKKPKNQALISRFFGPAPGRKPAKPAAAPSAPSSTPSSAAARTAAAPDAVASAKRAREGAERKKEEAPDAQALGSDSDSEADVAVARPKRRRLRRRVDDDEDEDFVVPDDADEEEEDVEAGDAVEEGEDVLDDGAGDDAMEDDDCGGAGPRAGGDGRSAEEVADGVLGKFTCGSQMVALRNEKRRKRFEKKVGRLDENRWFLRTTGGLGGGGDDVGGADAGVGQYALGAPAAARKGVKLTPLEQQFVDIKKKHLDTVLLVECGYKFQFFGDDALTASKVCRIYSGFKGNFSVASVPTVALARHVGRLVHAGHKVGIVRQMDTAALKKASDKASGPFRRKLCEVYTRGTLFADGQLDGSGAMLSGTAAAYIMAVFEEPRGDAAAKDAVVAVVAIDPATGDAVFDSFKDDAMRSELESRLLALEPVEIVVSAELSASSVQTVSQYCERANARLETSKDALVRKAMEESAKGASEGDLSAMVEGACRAAGIKSSATIMLCASALARYLKQFKLERAMWCAREFRVFTGKREVGLGADVMRNFEIFHNSNDGAAKGSLFSLIDRTKTAFGRRLLKHWLAHPLTCWKAIEARLEAVDALRRLVEDSGDAATGHGSKSADSCLIELLGSLASSPDLERGLARIAYERCTPSSFIAIAESFRSVAEYVQSLKEGIARERESESGVSVCLKSSRLVELVDAVPDVSDVLAYHVFGKLDLQAARANDYAGLYQSDCDGTQATYSGDDVGFPSPSRSKGSAPRDKEEKALAKCVGELKTCRERVAGCEGELLDLLKELRRAHGRPSWEWKKVAQDEYLLEVPVKAAKNVPKDWVVVNTTKSYKRFRPKKAAELLSLLEQARELCNDAASRAWKAFLGLFSTMCAELRMVTRFLCELDCLASHARTSLLPGYTRPDVVDPSEFSAGIHAKAARHPIAETLLRTAYVPNDVALGLHPKKPSTGTDAAAERERCMVITGPNMGGKSSFIRMAALLSIMAQVGLYVPADSARIAPFDAMYCRMGATDMIGKGLSTLMVELSETSKILEQATDRSLIVIDELGRGTSTHDGTAIATATLEHLVSRSSCIVLFVTHFPSIARLSDAFPGRVASAYLDYIEEADSGESPDELGTSANDAEGDRAAPSRRKKITFLYKVTKGIAGRSYGLNVAQLAGLPPSVLDMAAESSALFEGREALNKRDTGYKDLLLATAKDSSAANAWVDVVERF